MTEDDFDLQERALAAARTGELGRAALVLRAADQDAPTSERVAAIVGLSSLEVSESLDEFLYSLATEPDERVAWTALDAVRLAPSAEQVREVDLHVGSGRWHAAVLRFRLRFSLGDAEGLLRTAAKDPDGFVRQEVADSAGEMDVVAVLDVIDALCEDDDANVQEAAEWARSALAGDHAPAGRRERYPRFS